MELETLVRNFRKAIEAAQTNYELGEFFRKFPTGQCGHSSDMLAQYLIDNGIGPITYVSGTYYGDDSEDRWCHAWLVVDGLVVDITGDQFRHHPAPLTFNIPVYIGPTAEFHRLFEVGPADCSEHHGLERHWIHYHDLRSWYESILKYLI